MRTKLPLLCRGRRLIATSAATGSAHVLTVAVAVAVVLGGGVAFAADDYDPDLRERRETALAEQREARSDETQLAAVLAETEAELLAATDRLATATERSADARDELAALTVSAAAAETAAETARQQTVDALRDARAARSVVRRTQRVLDTEAAALQTLLTGLFKQGPAAAAPPGRAADAVFAEQALSTLTQGQAEAVERVADLRDRLASRSAAADAAARQAERLSEQARAASADADESVALQQAQADRVHTARERREQARAALAEELAASQTRLEEVGRELSDLDAALAAIEAEQQRRMVWPAVGRQSSPYGYRIHPVHGGRRLHSGLDIAAPRGTPIVAARGGRVVSAGGRGGYGLTVVIDHGGGLTTLYAHQSRVTVRSGQQVARGQKIGEIGTSGVSTGPHLHFEVRERGVPRNPRPYLP